MFLPVCLVKGKRVFFPYIFISVDYGREALNDEYRVCDYQRRGDKARQISSHESAGDYAR